MYAVVSQQCREEALSICRGRIIGLVIVFVFILAVCLFLYIRSHFDKGFIIATVVIFTIVTPFLLPDVMRETRLYRTVKEEEPVLCTVSGLGTERYGKRMQPVAYFDYGGKECYALNYDDKNPMVQEGEQIWVWNDRNNFVMVRAR